MPGEIDRRTPEENQALERLYGAKHPSEEHADAEAAFNRQREKRLRAEGFQGEYKPLRDVRHEFEFDEQRDAQGRRTQTIARSQEGCPLRRPEEVINWRHTKVGKDADDKARSAYHGSGDDAGHLISPEFGADPGDRRNLSHQNFVANQYGEFKKWENDCKSTVADQKEPHEIEVRVRYKPDGNREREIARDMHLYRRDEHNERQPVTNDKVVFFNPKNDAVRAAEAGQKPERGSTRQHAKEVRTAVDSMTPEERRAYAKNIGLRAVDSGPSKGKQK